MADNIYKNQSTRTKEMFSELTDLVSKQGRGDRKTVSGFGKADWGRIGSYT